MRGQVLERPAALRVETERHSRRWVATPGTVPLVFGLVFIVMVSLVALLAPLLTPETFHGFDHRAAAQHPGLSWRYLMGADAFGHSILMYVVLGARNTWGVAAGGLAVALSVAVAMAWLAKRLGRFGAWLVSSAGELVGAVPYFALVLVILRFEGRRSVWGMVATLGLLTAPMAASVLARRTREREGILRALVDVGGSILIVLVALAATVDFLRLGLPAADPSWGSALRFFPAYINGGLWWWLLFPCLALITTIGAVATVRHGLLQVMDRRGAGPGPSG